MNKFLAGLGLTAIVIGALAPIGVSQDECINAAARVIFSEKPPQNIIWSGDHESITVSGYLGFPAMTNPPKGIHLDAEIECHSDFAVVELTVNKRYSEDSGHLMLMKDAEWHEANKKIEFQTHLVADALRVQFARLAESLK
jgi:hypothetical protein